MIKKMVLKTFYMSRLMKKGIWNRAWNGFRNTKSVFKWIFWPLPFHRFLGSSEEWNSVLTKNDVSSPPSSPALTWPMCPVVVHPLSTICCPLSVSDIKLSLSNTFLTLSRQFGHFPDITNTFQTLQTLSRHYRHFPETSDTFQTLPRHYRHFPDISDTFRTFQTLSHNIRHIQYNSDTF